MEDNWKVWGIPAVSAILMPVFAQAINLDLLPSSNFQDQIAACGSFVGVIFGFYTFAFSKKYTQEKLRKISKYSLVSFGAAFVVLFITSKSRILEYLYRFFDHSELFLVLFEDLFLLIIYVTFFVLLSVLIFSCFEFILRTRSGK